MRIRTVAACFLSVISPLALFAQNGPDNDPNGLRGYVDNVFTMDRSIRSISTTVC